MTSALIIPCISYIGVRTQDKLCPPCEGLKLYTASIHCKYSDAEMLASGLASRSSTPIVSMHSYDEAILRLQTYQWAHGKSSSVSIPKCRFKLFWNFSKFIMCKQAPVRLRNTCGIDCTYFREHQWSLRSKRKIHYWQNGRAETGERRSDLIGSIFKDARIARIALYCSVAHYIMFSSCGLPCKCIPGHFSLHWISRTPYVPCNCSYWCWNSSR